MMPQFKKNKNNNKIIKWNKESNAIINNYISQVPNIKKYPIKKKYMNSTIRQNANIFDNRHNFCKTFSNFKNRITFENKKPEDLRLLFCLQMLDLENLNKLFKKNNIDFDTLLFIPFKDLAKLGLTENDIKKIHNFSVDYIKNGNLYTLEELKTYFENRKKIIKKYNSYDNKIYKNNIINNNRYCNIYNYINSVNNNFEILSDNKSNLDSSNFSNEMKKYNSKNLNKEYYNNTNKTISSIDSSNTNLNNNYSQEIDFNSKIDNTNNEILRNMNVVPTKSKKFIVYNYKTIYKNNIKNNNFNNDVKTNFLTYKSYEKKRNKEPNEFEINKINSLLKKSNTNSNNDIYLNLFGHNKEVDNLTESINNFNENIKNKQKTKNKNTYCCFGFNEKNNRNKNSLSYKNGNDMFQQIHKLKNNKENITFNNKTNCINNAIIYNNTQTQKNITKNNSRNISARNLINVNKNKCILAYTKNHSIKNERNYSILNNFNSKQKKLSFRQSCFDGKNY